MSWYFSPLATLSHGSWRNSKSYQTPKWIIPGGPQPAHLGGCLQVSRAAHQVAHDVSLEAMHCFKGVVCDFSHQKLGINSWQSAHKVSLGWTLGMAGPFSRSDFLIGYHPSVLGDPNYQRKDFQLILLFMALKSSKLTWPEMATLFE